MTLREVRAACPHDCPDTCAMLVTVEDGRATKVRGDPAHPPTHGALCTKVSRYTERTYHADRVLHPMRRTGPKGSGRFERIAWADAIAEIAERLTAIAGPGGRNAEAILPYSYAGTMGMLQGESMAGRFFHRLGASRLDRTICSAAGGEALVATYGAKVGMHVEHFAESRLIVVWGSNSITSNLHFWSYAQAAKRAGAHLVCIDPRRTETAEKCHDHIALLPGTDGALALGLMHELVVHGWLDHAYIERHTEGWPALRERAMQWPPERVAAACGIDADAVRGLARLYGTTKPAAIRLNYGMQRARGGGNAARLVAILPCLVGAWRERGGGMLLSASGWFRHARDDAALSRPDLLARSGVPNPRTLNMSTVGDELLREGDDPLRGGGETMPGGSRFGPRVEAVVVYNSNPVAIAPESGKVAKGFARDDLFTVVLEHFMTDTADLADIVLPATTQLEHLDLHTSYGHTWALVNEPAIAPIGEAKPNTQIFRELAAAMGFREPCFADDDEALAAQAFRPALEGGFDLADLRTHGYAKLAVADAPFAEGGFPTPSGRCRIDAPGWGVPDFLPNHESAASTPELAARFPLAMISPPARNFLNSTFVNVTSLRGGDDAEPVLELSDADAAARGIASGRRVRVFNDRGSIECVAQVGARARAGVVNGMGIWWKKLSRDGRNVNELTHQHLTDLGRGPSFYDCLVEVEAIGAVGPAGAVASAA